MRAIVEWRFVGQFPRVFRGTHVHDVRVRCLRGSRVRVEGDPATPVMVDGEVHGSLPMQIELTSHRLRVRVPDQEA